jgi:hypothetical protein
MNDKATLAVAFLRGVNSGGSRVTSLIRSPDGLL